MDVRNIIKTNTFCFLMILYVDIIIHYKSDCKDTNKMENEKKIIDLFTFWGVLSLRSKETKKITEMKKLISILLIAMMTMTAAFAQNRTANRNASTYAGAYSGYRSYSNGSSSTRTKTYTVPTTRTKSVTTTPSAKPTGPVKHYTNSRGVRVQSPTRYSSAPSGATARCNDGTYSFSRNRRGTCSHHGGVAEWL